MRHFDRRKFLACSLQLPMLVVVARTAEAACADPDEMSDSVRGMRESLEYSDAASDPNKTCSGCSFFRSDKASAGCGQCEVLTGPVNSKGHCVSWTKRA
jgi:High potential iron-sulfur protein